MTATRLHYLDDAALVGTWPTLRLSPDARDLELSETPTSPPRWFRLSIGTAGPERPAIAVACERGGCAWPGRDWFNSPLGGADYAALIDSIEAPPDLLNHIPPISANASASLDLAADTLMRLVASTDAPEVFPFRPLADFVIARRAEYLAVREAIERGANEMSAEYRDGRMPVIWGEPTRYHLPAERLAAISQMEISQLEKAHALRRAAGAADSATSMVAPSSGELPPKARKARKRRKAKKLDDSLLALKSAYQAPPLKGIRRDVLHRAVSPWFLQQGSETPSETTINDALNLWRAEIAAAGK